MTQSGSNTNVIIWLVANHPKIVSIVLAGILLLVILVVILVVGWLREAYNEGKEIGFWKFHIGPNNLQPHVSSYSDSLNSVDKDIRNSVRDLFPGCDDKKTILDRKPKQGQVSRIGYEHVVFGWETVKSIFDKLSNDEILQMSKAIGEGAATSLCDQIRKRLTDQSNEIINNPKKIFGLLSFWDDTGGWGVYEADTESCKTKWQIEITNHFLKDRNVDIAIAFWSGYFKGFVRSYCNIRNIQNQNDMSQNPLVPDKVHCLTRPTVASHKIVCTIDLIQQKDNQ